MRIFIGGLNIELDCCLESIDYLLRAFDLFLYLILIIN